MKINFRSVVTSSHNEWLLSLLIYFISMNSPVTNRYKLHICNGSQVTCHIRTQSEADKEMEFKANVLHTSICDWQTHHSVRLQDWQSVTFKWFPTDRNNRSINWMYFACLDLNFPKECARPKIINIEWSLLVQWKFLFSLEKTNAERAQCQGWRRNWIIGLKFIFLTR